MSTTEEPEGQGDVDESGAPDVAPGEVAGEDSVAEEPDQEDIGDEDSMPDPEPKLEDEEREPRSGPYLDPSAED